MGKGKYKTFLKFHSVSFSYDSAIDYLFDGVSFHIAGGWTGVVGANGAGKTTLLKLAAGLLKPGAGLIESPGDTFYCPQRTDHVPRKLRDFILSCDKSARIIKKRLSIQGDWWEAERWVTLSFGERKRAQLAVALWQDPEILAIDEPTNHLDSHAREMIADALFSFNHIGLLVSHDRELLDSLCSQCLFLEPPRVILRRGNYTQVIAAVKEEEKHMRKLRTIKKQAFNKLNREAGRRRELAKQSKKRRSKKGLAAKDHDARAKVDLARLSGKDGVGGKLQRQMQGRLSQARQDMDGVKVKKEYSMGIWLAGSVSSRNFLLDLPADSLDMGDTKQLDFPRLSILPTDRISITGVNGSGKSTLIKHILKFLNAPVEQITYLPQEVTAEQSRKIFAQARELPNDKLGYLMTVISRLGSRPTRLLDSIEPSPGEIRKLLLALGMTHEPHMIIMDEPVNHLDLPSIECLEEALSECPCSLLLVSHDKIFLDKLIHKQWNIRKNSSEAGKYELKIMD